MLSVIVMTLSLIGVCHYHLSRALRRAYCRVHQVPPQSHRQVQSGGVRRRDGHTGTALLDCPIDTLANDINPLLHVPLTIS